MSRTRQLLFGPVLAISIAAGAAASAPAMPADRFVPAGSSSAADEPAPPVRVVHVSSDSGFDWRDAEIGAGAVLALGLLGAGGTVAVRSRRRRGRLATTT
jgi:hypothetical protein